MKCDFCGTEIHKGTGHLYVKKDGAVFRFCSTKCEKNQFLGRSKRKTRWTNEYHKEKGIRMKSKQKEGEKK